jgi:hypothetical protein
VGCRDGRSHDAREAVGALQIISNALIQAGRLPRDQAVARADQKGAASSAAVFR